MNYYINSKQNHVKTKVIIHNYISWISHFGNTIHLLLYTNIIFGHISIFFINQDILFLFHHKPVTTYLFKLWNFRNILIKKSGIWGYFSSQWPILLNFTIKTDLYKYFFTFSISFLPIKHIEIIMENIFLTKLLIRY